MTASYFEVYKKTTWIDRSLEGGMDGYVMKKIE